MKRHLAAIVILTATIAMSGCESHYDKCFAAEKERLAAKWAENNNSQVLRLLEARKLSDRDLIDSLRPALLTYRQEFAEIYKVTCPQDINKCNDDDKDQGVDAGRDAIAKAGMTEEWELYMQISGKVYEYSRYLKENPCKQSPQYTNPSDVDLEKATDLDLEIMRCQIDSFIKQEANELDEMWNPTVQNICNSRGIYE